MKTGWKSLIVAGVVLIILSGQVMAQPWGGGPGQGRGMGWRSQGPGSAGTEPMGPGAPQSPGDVSGPAGRRPLDRGAWAPGAAGQRPFPRASLDRLNLTEEQRDRIRDILTEEQAERLGRFRQTRDRISQARPGNRNPQRDRAFRPRDGRLPQGTWRRGGGMGPGVGQGWQCPRGRGRFGQSFRGGPGFGPGRQGYAPAGPGGRGRSGQWSGGGRGFGRGWQGDTRVGPGPGRGRGYGRW